jgi:hypothetical protein
MFVCNKTFAQLLVSLTKTGGILVSNGQSIGQRFGQWNQRVSATWF